MRLERAREGRGLRANAGLVVFQPTSHRPEAPAKRRHDMAELLVHGGDTVPQGWRTMPRTYKEIAG